MLAKTNSIKVVVNQNKSARNLVALVFLLSLVLLAHASVVLDFQAEDMAGYDPDNLRQRSNAANVRSVLLQNFGDYLRFPICLLADGLVSVEEVRYSTDGGSKTGAVLLDGQEIGTFKTLDNSNYGFNWNAFSVSGPFSAHSLTKGNHTIDVQLKTGSDHWGMEIDQIKIDFRENVPCREEDNKAGTTGYNWNTSLAPNSYDSTPSSDKHGILSSNQSLLSVVEASNDNSLSANITATTTNSSASDSNSTVSNTTSAPSNCSRTEHFSMGIPFNFRNLYGNLILKKNVYNACQNNEYRLDLFTQGEIKGMTLNISRDGQDLGGCKSDTTPIPDYQTESPRKTVFSVGKADEDVCSLQTNELANLTSDAFFILDRLNATLPAKVDPAQLSNFSLQFSLPEISATDSFIFSMFISCPSEGWMQLGLNITLLDTDSGELIDKQQLFAEFQDSESKAKLSLTIPSFIRQAEVRVHIMDNQTTFVLNGLTLDYPARSNLTAYDLWIPAAQKRQVLFSYDGIRVEVVSQPGARQMMVKMKSTGTFPGGTRQFSGSRILVYSTQDNTSQLQMIFDQTSRSYFFPERDPSHQVSFHLGQPDLDVEIVEVDIYGYRSLSLTLTQGGLPRRMIYINPLTWLTMVNLIDISNTLFPMLFAPQMPLSAAAVPCADNQLTSEGVIKVDDADSVTIKKLPMIVTGQVIRLSWP